MKILEFLKDRGEATRTEITVDCFQRHVAKTRIDIALDELLQSNPPAVEVHEDRSSAGRPSKTYRLCVANKANKANNQNPRGIATDFVGCEQSEQSIHDARLVRIVSLVSNAENQQQSHASIESSHSSHGETANSDSEVL